MIRAVALLLLFQLAGELITRSLGLSLPGPVLGMAGLFAAFLLFPALHGWVTETARGLLANLSLLFVPAAVGIVRHLDALGEGGVPVMIAIIVSTVLAIGVGALVFVGVDRLTGDRR